MLSQQSNSVVGGKIGVVLADDHQLFRQGLKALLSTTTDIEIVGEANDGLEVQRVVEAQAERTDVVVMDISMPIADGLSAARELIRFHPKLGIIILSMHDEQGMVFQALRTGARGYVLKNSAGSFVAEAIRRVAMGEGVIDPAVTATVVGEFRRISKSTGAEDGLGCLTAMEIRVLQHVAAGMSNKEIGQKLSIAESTVKNRLSVLFDKISVLDRTQAAIWGITHGIAPSAIQQRVSTDG